MQNGNFAVANFEAFDDVAHIDDGVGFGGHAQDCTIFVQVSSMFLVEIGGWRLEAGELKEFNLQSSYEQSLNRNWSLYYSRKSQHIDALLCAA